jgi:hypothetical protein
MFEMNKEMWMRGMNSAGEVEDKCGGGDDDV